MLATVQPIALAEDTANTDGGYSAYASEIEALNALGITDIKEKGFSENDKVSRENFAKGVVSMMVEDISAVGIETKGDLSSADKGLLYLNSVGIVNGTGENVFEPNAVITLEQAVKIAVSALGFDELSYYKGGYSVGFLTEAKRIGLLDGVKASGSDELTLGNSIKLLYNLLDTDILQQKTFGSSNTYYRVDGNTLVSVYRDIRRGSGTVTANRFSGIYSAADGTSGDTVIIGSTEYAVGGTAAEGYIVCSTEFWYKDSRSVDEKTLIYIAQKSNSRSLKIDAANIISFSGGKYSYETESGKTADVSIADDAVILYNGVFAESIDVDKYIPKYGSVEFIANGSGAYGIVKIENVTLTVVESVSTDGLVIYDKYDQSLNIDLTDADYAIYSDKGKRIEVASIVKGNIIESVKTEYGAGVYYRMTVETATITEKVEKIRTKAGGELNEVYLASEKYSVSYRLRDLIKNKKINELQLGTTYVFALNTKGELVNVDNDSEKSYRLGYLKRFSADKDSMDPQPSVRIFDQSGSWETYLLAKNLKLNGEPIKSNTLKSMDYYLGQVCKYELNISGNVTSMYFPSASDENFKTVYTRKSPYYRAYAAGGVFGAQSDKTGATCSLEPNATIFVVPDKETLSVNETADGYQYAVLAPKTLKGYVPYTNVDIFNTSGEIGIGDVALVKMKNYGYVASSSSRPIVISECRSVAKDGGVKQAIYGMQNGQEVEIFIEDMRSDTSELPFKSGDVIFCFKSGDGILRLYDDVKYYHKIFSYDPQNPTFTDSFDWNTGNIIGISYSASMASDERMRYGSVYKADADYVWLNISSDPSDTSKVEAARCTGARIYVYDDKNETFKIGKPADIVGYTSDSTNYAKALIVYNDGFTEMVIYP